MKFNPTTPVTFYVKKSEYELGEGVDSSWTLLESIITQATETNPERKTSIFYCEWKGGFGDRLLSAQSLGVNDMATLRMHFNPLVFEAIRSCEVLVVMNCDGTAFVDGVPSIECKNLYESWSGIDNVNQENQFMEFKVRRYEEK